MMARHSNGPVAAEQLRLLVERIETLEAGKKGIADDIKGVYAEAKAVGFDPKTIRTIVKLRTMDPHDRREMEALLDLYKGALGMLDGTPLGRWATERAASPKPDAEGPEDGQEPAEGAEGDTTDADAAPDPDVPPPPPPPTVEDAREMGGQAAADGKPVTANPFPPRDERRAAWDEAWCQASGTDGMDIPDFLKPSAKTRKPKGDEPGPAGGSDSAEGGEGKPE
jgi:uncharacterized protein (UPF0335 family)